MKIKIVMITVLVISLVTLTTTFIFGIINRKNRRLAKSWGFNDGEEWFDNDEE